MRYEFESIDRAWYDKHFDLLSEAYAEVGDGDGMSPDIDDYRLRAMDLTSFVVVVYTDAGEAVGILMVAISRGSHSDLYDATNDLIYVKPAYRNLGIGARLFKLAEETAAERGATRFLWAVPPTSPLDAALARRKKTHPLFERVYCRYLDE